MSESGIFVTLSWFIADLPLSFHSYVSLPEGIITMSKMTAWIFFGRLDSPRLTTIIVLQSGWLQQVLLPRLWPANSRIHAGAGELLVPPLPHQAGKRNSSPVFFIDGNDGNWIGVSISIYFNLFQNQRTFQVSEIYSDIFSFTHRMGAPEL